MFMNNKKQYKTRVNMNIILKPEEILINMTKHENPHEKT